MLREAGGDHDGAARRHRLDGVLEQVEQDLFHHRRVAGGDHRAAAVELQLRLDTRVVERRLQEPGHADRDLVEILPQHERCRPRAAIEPRADDARHAVDLRQEQPHPVHAAQVVLGLEVVAQELQVAAHRIERRADLVREGGRRLVHQREPVEAAGPLLQCQEHGAGGALPLPGGERLAHPVIAPGELAKLGRADLWRGRRVLGAAVGARHGGAKGGQRPADPARGQHRHEQRHQQRRDECQHVRPPPLEPGPVLQPAGRDPHVEHAERAGHAERDRHLPPRVDAGAKPDFGTAVGQRFIGGGLGRRRVRQAARGDGDENAAVETVDHRLRLGAAVERPSLERLRQAGRVAFGRGAHQQRGQGVRERHRLQAEVLEPRPGRPPERDLRRPADQDDRHDGRQHREPARQTHRHQAASTARRRTA